MQAQRCMKPECRGWLLEQRADNLHAGEAWACTACGASVPSHHVDGASGPQDRADALRQKWRQALGTVRGQVRALQGSVRVLANRRTSHLSWPCWGQQRIAMRLCPTAVAPAQVPPISNMLCYMQWHAAGCLGSNSGGCLAPCMDVCADMLLVCEPVLAALSSCS